MIGYLLSSLEDRAFVNLAVFSVFVADCIVGMLPIFGIKIAKYKHFYLVLAVGWPPAPDFGNMNCEEKILLLSWWKGPWALTAELCPL